MIPYGRQNISQEDIDSVVTVLKSDNLTQGKNVPNFERNMAKYVGAKHAIAVNSATSALHIAYLALGVDNQSRVWTTPITFVATTNAALMCGAQIDFVDIDPETSNICPLALESKLTAAEVDGKLPDLVVVVHLGGYSCDMKSIFKLSKKYNFKIVEDASHAVGGKFFEQYVGKCEYSDITIFSFHPVKIITTGEGGAALTNDDSLAHKMALLRSHGITRLNDEMTKTADGPWYYQQHFLGFNYRMNDISAALGVSQLKRLDKFVVERQCIANRYNQYFRGTNVKTPKKNKNILSSFHLYIIKVDKKIRNDLFRRLRETGIFVNLHYIPIYRQPYYSTLGFLPKNYPEAEKYYREAISIPIFPGLSNKDQSYVVENILNPPGQQVLF